MPEALEILVEGTPNPNAAKFTLNRIVSAQGKTYRLPAPPQNVGGAQAGDAAGADAPWANALLVIPGITQVFAVSNFISVTKTPQAEWDAIVPHVEEALRRVFVT